MVKTHQFTEARRATQARPEVRRPCHAFTLIELLVVCGIIAILASLLLPGLARAKTKAHNSLCISNLRELGMATRLYSEDNQNRLPSAEILPTNPIDPQRPLPRICDVLAHVLGTTATSNSATVFKCPDDRVGLFASEGSSYEWNADLNGHQIDETKTAVLYRVWQPMEAPPGARTERCFSRPRRRRCCSIMRTSISARRNLARTSCSWMGMLLLWTFQPIEVTRCPSKGLFSSLILWHNSDMTEIFRVRIDRKLLAQASRVAEDIGTTPGEIVRLLFMQLVKRRRVPFSLSADPDDLVDIARRNTILKELDDAEGW